MQCLLNRIDHYGFCYLNLYMICRYPVFSQGFLQLIYEVILHQMPYRYIYTDNKICVFLMHHSVQEFYSAVEYPDINLVDKTNLLSDRYKVSRTDKSSILILHTCKGFKASKLMVYIVLWLEIIKHLILIQSISYLSLYLNSLL